MRLKASVLAIVLLSACQVRDTPLNFANSRTLPLPDLAREVGNLIAASIVEADRPNADGRLLRLATRPRPSGSDGLCQAAWIDVEFQVTVTAKGEVVSRGGVEDVTSRPVFRAIAPTAPKFTTTQQWDTADAALAAACPRENHVLNFFEAPSATSASIAAQVVEVLAAEAATTTPLPFQTSCGGLPEPCERARTEWIRLRRSGILAVKDDHCAAQSERCVEISVAKNANDLQGDLWIISATVTDAEAEARLTDVISYRRIRIKRLIVREAYVIHALTP